MAKTLEQPIREQSELLAPVSHSDPVTLSLLLVAVGLLIAVAWPVLTTWVSTYGQQDSDYAYGFIVPFLVGLMLWHRRSALAEAGLRPCPGALVLLLPALALLELSLKRQFSTLSSFSLLISLWAAVWLLLGTQWVRAAAFPLAFLMWMAPLPGPIIHDSTYSCQQLSTVLANRALHLLTFPTSLSGNVITMDTFVLFVDVPCSGMKLLLTMLMFGSVFAWLTDGSGWRRVGLFLATFPLSLAVNTLRITVLGILGDSFGAPVEHLFHDTSGLLTVAIGLVILFWIARRIGCRNFAGWPLF
jgi:exosortase